MQLRELSETDLPALSELCRRALSDPTDERLLRRLFLGEPDFTPGYHLVIVEHEQLVGVVLGGVRARPEGLVGGVRLLVVAPERQRQGLAGQLLDELERRMAADGLDQICVGRLAPNYLWPGLDPQLHTPALCLLLSRGYVRSGDAVNMALDLTARDWGAELNALRLPAGWSVRRAVPADREPALAWVNEHWSFSWRFESELAFAAPVPTLVLARRDAQIGGFACWDVSGLWGTFGPTGTASPLRGQGLGRALLLASLAAMHAQGYRRAEIGWTGPIAFYAHAADAQISRVCWFLAKQL